jgi:hypothetical protein
VPEFDPSKLINIGRWFDTQPGPGSTWHVILGALFAIGIVVGTYLYQFYANQQLRNDRYRASLARNVGQGLLWVCIFGLIVVFFRLLDVGFFGMRLWLYLDLLIGIGLAVYLGYYMFKIYPVRLAAIQRAAARQAYLPRQREHRPAGRRH